MSEGNLIDAVCHHIQSDKERLLKNELKMTEVQNFDLTAFWSQLGAALQSLNNEVTKISFMCGKKPFPSSTDLNCTMQDLIQRYNIVKDLYLLLPLNVGAVLHRAVTSAVVSVMSSLFDFVRSLHTLTEKGSKERLTLTGTFWDACNAFDTLPKDNLQATLKVLGNEVDLAKDAKEELETTLQEDAGGDDESWTDLERKLAHNALGLTKVTAVCVKRLRDAVSKTGSTASTQQLDNIARLAATVSPALDNFVSELYHPIDFPTVCRTAEKLVEVLRSLLATIIESNFLEAFGMENVIKLDKFIEHNHQKLDPSITTPSALASLLLDCHVTS